MSVIPIDVVNRAIDPTFSFMTADHDGHIRTDPSSPYAMARVVAMKDKFRVIVANDVDADRHGIVRRSAGLVPSPGGTSTALPRPPVSRGLRESVRSADARSVGTVEEYWLRARRRMVLP
jgi:hypothetical protein